MLKVEIVMNSEKILNRVKNTVFFNESLKFSLIEFQILNSE